MNQTQIMDEVKLLQNLRRGNHHAFEQIYETYYYNLTGHIFRFLKSTELAKEVVQDTFMALWEHRDRIDVNRPIKPYLYRIATNLTYNVLKKAAHSQKYRNYLLPIIEDGYEQIETALFKKENEQILQDILQKMPNRQREVFILCKIQGKSYQEVCELLNISFHTVNTHIKRSTQFLKQNISEYPLFLLLVLQSSTGFLFFN